MQYHEGYRLIGMVFFCILVELKSITTQNRKISMNKNQKFLIGSVGALLTGIAIGLLVAPKKGKDTRKLIKHKANDLSGTAKDKYEKSVEEISHIADKLKEGFLKNVDTVKEKAGHVAENVNDKVRSVIHQG